MLYTWNLYNIVHQPHLNLKVFPSLVKWKKQVQKKHILYAIFCVRKGENTEIST